MTPDPSDLNARADALAKRAQDLTKDEDTAADHAANAGESQALRLVSDFSAAALVGAGLGYGVDAWLETSPWGLIVGLFIGVAAGTRRMLQQED